MSLRICNIGGPEGLVLLDPHRHYTFNKRNKGRPLFERFTDRARRVLVLAQEEARDLNHAFIGTEHILLGLIREGEGVAAKALDALGVTFDVVREKVEEAIGANTNPSPGSPPFTPRAKKVLELSLREALQLGHSYIGTEHMLLGLVREGEGVAAQVLNDLGADMARVRTQVIQMMSGQAGKEAGATSAVGSSKSATPRPRAARPSWTSSVATSRSSPARASSTRWSDARRKSSA